MAKKKKISTEEKIKKYKRNRKLSIALKIMTGLLVAALMVPTCYYGYYFVVFSIMPIGNNADKSVGEGFSRPLHMISKNEASDSFILAYYYDDCWHVVDDGKKLKENRDNFTIYKKDDEWHDDKHLQLLLVKNGYLLNNVPLSEFTLIDDRCFRDCMKTMTMDEFYAYCEEKDLQSMYIH